MRYRILVLAACLLPVAAAPSPGHRRRASRRIRASRATGFVSTLTAPEASTGLARRYRRAQLLPGVTAGGGRGGRGRGGRGGAPAAQPSGPNPAGVPYIVVAQPCGGGGGGRSNGALLVNPDSGGVHFVEHKDEVIFAGERGGVRHILPRRAGAPDSVDPDAGRALGRSLRRQHARRGNDRVHARRGTRRWRPHFGDDARRAFRGVSGRPAAHRLPTPGTTPRSTRSRTSTAITSSARRR